MIRAISKTMDKDWEDTYLDIVLQGFLMHDMPSSNDVWGTYLLNNGFRRYVIPDSCPDCYTVSEFVNDNPEKRRFQLKQLNEDLVIEALKDVCREIKEFIHIIYSCTDMPIERDTIKEMLSDLNKQF